MALNKQQLTLVSGLGLGAGLMYLLDPQGGKGRRTAVKDKTSNALSTSGNAIRKTSQNLGSRSKDLAAGVRSKLSRGESDNTEGGQALESNVGSQDSQDGQSNGKLQMVRKWGGSAVRVLAGTAGAGLAVAGAKRRDKVGAALGAVGLGLLAGSGAGQRLLALRHRGNGSQESVQSQSDESNGSLQAGSVTVNQPEATFATLGDTEAAAELRSLVEDESESSSPESHVH